MKTKPSMGSLLSASLAVLFSASALSAEPAEQRLLNVSFGFTRDFFVDYNAWFAARWKAETGRTVVIEQSHAASGTQTLAVIKGKLQPDVVALAGPGDFDAIAARTDLLPKNWREEFPLGSSPYYSAVAFAVRAGNPKGIHGWDDLAKPGLLLVTSNPKGCGGGLWNYTAAYAHGLRTGKGDAAKARAYVEAFYANAPVCYVNQGASGEVFFKGTGDALITYESFLLGLKNRPQAKIAEAVYPANSVEIELPVAVVRKFTDARGTTALAEAYLRGLYDSEAQALLAKHNFRPRQPGAAARFAERFPKTALQRGEDVFGSWEKAAREHFDDKALFDEIHSGTASAAR